VEGVARQEGVAELRVAKFVVTILVKPLDEQGELFISHNEAQVDQTCSKIFQTGLACSILVKDSECIDQVEISLETQLNFRTLNLAFNFKL
jgi:hypothetical protein